MENFKSFLTDEEAVSTVEIILILVVLIALVVLFREQITGVVRSILGKVTNQANTF